jgi:hypothetical protein
MDFLARLVSLYLDYAELQAKRKIPMSMEDKQFLSDYDRYILEEELSKNKNNNIKENK